MQDRQVETAKHTCLYCGCTRAVPSSWCREEQVTRRRAVWTHLFGLSLTLAWLDDNMYDGVNEVDDEDLWYQNKGSDAAQPKKLK